MRNDRIIQALLAFLVLFDLTLVVWAFGFADLWFELFHESPEAREKARLLLTRCGANWAGFALFQAIALRYWKRHEVWLAVVAGVRFSDIFTDLVYVAFADDPTWFAWATPPAMGAINLGLGWYLLTSYLQRRKI